MSERLQYSVDELTVRQIKTDTGKTIMSPNDEYTVMDLTLNHTAATVASATSTLFSFDAVLPFDADLRAFAVTTGSAVTGSCQVQLLRGASVMASLTLLSGINAGYATYGIGSIQMSAGNVVTAKFANATNLIAAGARIDSVFRKR